MKRVVLLMFIMMLPYMLHANWRADIKKASLEYANSKKNELIAQNNKKAIIALYKKLYPNLKNKSEKEALRALGDLGMNASKLNDIASNLASGDPKKMKNATQSLGVEVGQRLSKVLKDPYLRGKMQGLLNNVDEFNKISTALGAASGGDSKALYEYAATTFINAAGGGGVMSFYTTAYGAMKFAKDAYMDSTVEELYQKYKNGKLDKDSFDLQTTLGGYATVIRDRIIKERQKKLEELGNSDISPELRKHLTQVSQADIQKEMFASFEGRKNKEEKEEQNHEQIKAYEAQAKTLLSRFNDIASKKYGRNWSDADVFGGFNLNKYLHMVDKLTNKNRYLDPANKFDLEKMASLIATQVVHGKNSKEYKEAFKAFQKYIKVVKGVDVAIDDFIPFSGSIKGSWSGTSTGQYRFKAKGGFSFTISSNGVISGKYWGDDSGTLRGKVNASGNMNFKSGGGTAGSAKWSGSIRRDKSGNLVGSGSFRSKGWSGSWQGSGR